MLQDIIDQVEPYRTNESGRWAKLASNVQWRRLVILLLREIVVELRALRSQMAKLDTRRRADSPE
jgi:hypothetical protein